MRNDNSKIETRMVRRKRTSYTKIRIAKKLYFFMIVFFAMLLYIGIYKIYDIKYVSGKSNNYETQAIYNQVNKIQDKIINPNRGAIFDRNKQSLAISFTVYNVVLDVRNYDKLTDKEKNEVLNSLNENTGISMDELKEIVKKDSSGNLVNDTNYKLLKKDDKTLTIEYEDGQKLKDKNLKCVYLEEDTKRIYPNDSLASQVVGFIRGDSSWGLESYYNDIMTGTPGRIFRTYEENNSIITQQESAQDGYSLITTIDQTMQQYAENAVKTAYSEYNAENTAAIIMNPNTGEILAMASYPSFDLNNPENISLLDDKNYKSKWDKMSNEEKSNAMLKAWKNFNITDTFEPGSIFKPIVVAAALEEGVIKETDSFYCGGKKVFGEDEVPCHKLAGHGMQTLEQVLANSCNVGMIDISLKLGAEKFYKYQHDFGYGRKTGIDLFGEATAEKIMYSLDMLKSNIYLATSSIGQGFSATSMQSVNAFSAVINGGNVMKPYLVSQMVDKDGNIVEEHSPKIVRKVISQSTSDYLRNALESVISETGTGKKAKIDGYAIGGKTGTAQQGDRKKNMYTCSFIAYLPVDNPEVIVGLFIHKPTPYIDGVTSPAPATKELLLNIINYKAMPPDYESNSNNSVAAKNSEIVVGDYVNKNLLEVINELNTNNIKYEIVGNGDLIYKQSPSANNKIDKLSKIILFAKQNDASKEFAIVPNVESMNSEQAKKLIEDNGFLCDIIQQENTENTESTPESETSQNSDDKTSNQKIIVEQYPNAEVKIEKGAVIRLIEN